MNLQRGGAYGWRVLLLAAALFIGATAPLSAQRTPTPTPSPEVTTEPAAEPTAEADGQASEGYIYTVQRGDSWSSIARHTGLSVRRLQDANPQLVRPTGWLLVGEQLTVPSLPGQAGAEAGAEADVYVVQAGESWNSIAEKLGVPARLLQAANPRSVRDGMVLYRGERLVIPPVPGEAEPEAEETAAPEETAVITDTTAVTTTVTITAAEEPAPAETATEEPAATLAPTATPTETPTEEPAATAAPTDTPTEEPAATTEPTATPEPTTEPEPAAEPQDELQDGAYEVQPGESWSSIARKFGVTPAELQAANPDLVRPNLVLFRGDRLVIPAPGAPTAGAEPAAEGETEAEAAAPTAAPGCPAAWADYPEALVSLTSGPDAIEALRAYLDGCGALVEDAFVVQDFTGDALDDVLFIYANPATVDAVTPENDLMIFVATEQGLELGHRARAGGQVRLLSTEDMNADGQADVAWVDTTCGASTCFDTISVRSWDGSIWRDWTDATITMAYPETTLEDVSEEGQGLEIVLAGGVYGSVGAGPQRSRTETWGSIGGAPYTLLSLVHDSSECLYHLVIDANEAFLKAPTDGFSLAEALYTEVLGNEEKTACWVREDEVNELRSFSYFRLALIAAYQDLPTVAADVIMALEAEFPDSVYAQVGRFWLDTYDDSGDVNEACIATVAYAEEFPPAWEILADYGYANPSFDPTDVCPLLELEPPPAAAQRTPAAEAAAGRPAPETAAEAGAEAGAEAAPLADLPAIECPATLSGYVDTLPQLLAEAGGRQPIMEAWLRQCDAMTAGRGYVLLGDFNADGFDDAAFFPTIVSDLGFGPGGSQGAVLIYHGRQDGAYTLALNPETYGQPAPLAAEDLNGDGAPELAWTVTSCTNFCVLGVQIESWNGESYAPAILPGATIAEGTARFASIADGPGSGQQLILEGGMSGTPEGGLAVPHSETWQSIDGAPYRRLSWTYDRSADGANCLGLRLVEADAALQAADILGYQPSIDLYVDALGNASNACSLFGMNPDEELKLLQGLGTFRLIQALALSGELERAASVLEGLKIGQKDTNYTAAADQWLVAFTADGDAAAACSAVQAIFDENEEMWQITDHFGYNHPALAAEQVCFVPRPPEEQTEEQAG